MTDYFEDMWLSVENELSGLDNFKNDFTNIPSSQINDGGVSPQDGSTDNLDPKSYEDLLKTDSVEKYKGKIANPKSR